MVEINVYENGYQVVNGKEIIYESDDLMLAQLHWLAYEVKQGKPGRAQMFRELVLKQLEAGASVPNEILIAAMQTPEVKYKDRQQMQLAALYEIEFIRYGLGKGPADGLDHWEPITFVDAVCEWCAGLQGQSDLNEVEKACNVKTPEQQIDYFKKLKKRLA